MFPLKPWEATVLVAKFKTKEYGIKERIKDEQKWK
jgi:hypothetical protein